MPFLLLIRHGENDHVKKGRLAGRLPGIHLNEKGREQAAELAQALADVPIKAVYSSPLERAIETAEPIARAKGLEVILRPGLSEVDVGKWQGRSLKLLRLYKHWKVVQQTPSRAQFPEGETFYQAQSRVVGEVDAICAAHKPHDVVACIFHADPIKLAVAHYIGLPLDNFQRLSVNPGSLTLLIVSKFGARLIWLNQKPPFKFPLPTKK